MILTSQSNGESTHPIRFSGHIKYDAFLCFEKSTLTLNPEASC